MTAPKNNDGPRKRDGGSIRRKHDRNKFRKVTNPSLHKNDLTGGLNGILFTCTPHHERQAVREGVLLLMKHVEELSEADSANGAGKQSEKTAMRDLDDELKDLRSVDKRTFTFLDTGVTGAIFLRVNSEKVTVSLESLVESALRNARETGSPHSTHCIRVMPIHNTCYARPEDAAKATLAVVKEHFPVLPPKEDNDGKSDAAVITFAIAFRARLNSSAHRNDFIPVIADVIHKYDDRYKVNLTSPDVTLIVEIFKTNCCIGTFQHFFELAKMNLREAACPTIPKEDPASQSNDADVKKEQGSCDGQAVGNKDVKDEVKGGSKPSEEQANQKEADVGSTSKCTEEGHEKNRSSKDGASEKVVEGAEKTKTDECKAELNADVTSEGKSDAKPDVDAGAEGEAETTKTESVTESAVKAAPKSKTEAKAVQKEAKEEANTEDKVVDNVVGSST